MELTTYVDHKTGIKFTGQNTLNEQLRQERILKQIKYFRTFNAVMFKGNDRSREIVKEALSWDMLLHDNPNKLEEHEVFEHLKNSNILVNNFKDAEAVFKRKKARHDIFSSSLEEFKETEVFQNARQQVVNVHGHELVDGTFLYDYQVDCAALIVGRRRLLNAMDMGLGKTRTTIAGLTADPRNKKIIIVTMSRNIQDWESEIVALGFGDDYIELKNPSHMKSTKRIHLVSYERWVQETSKKEINPNTDEAYSSFPDNCPQCNEKWALGHSACSCGFTFFSKRKKPLYKYFNRSYDAAAIDEGHLIKNGNTARCRSIMAIKTKTRVLLSGTPAENGASDLFWPLAWLLGDNLHFWNKVSYTKFEAYQTFGERCFKHVYGGIDKKTLMDSAGITSRTSNTKELWELQDRFVFRKLKSDEDVKNVIRIPKPIHHRLHIEQTEPEKALYANIMTQFNEWFKNMKAERYACKMKGIPYSGSSLEITVWLEKLRRAASAPWLHEDFNNPENVPLSKLQFMTEHIQQMASKKKKMLVFTAHKATSEELGMLLGFIVPGYEAAYIHGGVPMERRKDLLKRFQDPNDSLSILIMTMKTGAESYTLTEAKSVVLWDLDYNAKKIEQCYSRAVRIGQKDAVDIFWLINVDTIDANLHSLILSKQSSVDLAIDRKELDFAEIAKEFEGQKVAHAGNFDYEQFATEMLSRGNSRTEYER